MIPEHVSEDVRLLEAILQREAPCQCESCAAGRHMMEGLADDLERLFATKPKAEA